jgi:hypothetical protein
MYNIITQNVNYPYAWYSAISQILFIYSIMRLFQATRPINRNKRIKRRKQLNYVTTAYKKAQHTMSLLAPQ